MVPRIIARDRCDVTVPKAEIEDWLINCVYIHFASPRRAGSVHRALINSILLRNFLIHLT